MTPSSCTLLSFRRRAVIVLLSSHARNSCRPHRSYRSHTHSIDATRSLKTSKIRVFIDVHRHTRTQLTQVTQRAASKPRRSVFSSPSPPPSSHAQTKPNPSAKNSPLSKSSIPVLRIDDWNASFIPTSFRAYQRRTGGEDAPSWHRPFPALLPTGTPLILLTPTMTHAIPHPPHTRQPPSSISSPPPTHLALKRTPQPPTVPVPPASHVVTHRLLPPGPLTERVSRRRTPARREEILIHRGRSLLRELEIAATGCCTMSPELSLTLNRSQGQNPTVSFHPVIFVTTAPATLATPYPQFVPSGMRPPRQPSDTPRSPACGQPSFDGQLSTCITSAVPRLHGPLYPLEISANRCARKRPD
ncbi:hypothetical protein P692DRAFT_20876053 [Suillus brevipes Sb2]|nr:hypothetical protein P692DRAFT_20876053 [Suillus brevipes Sb2]